MIIVLKDADFSANKIGTVEIPVEIDEYTQAAITASGNASMTVSQQQALMRFFTAIGANSNSGVSTKLTRIYLPIICNNVAAKALVNYKTNVVDADASANVNYTMESKGLRVATLAKNTGNGAAISLGKVKLNMQDVSCLYLNTASYSGSGRVFSFANGVANDSRFGSLNAQISSGKYNIDVNTNNSYKVSTSGTLIDDGSIALRGFSVNSLSGKFLVKDSSTINDVTVASWSDYANAGAIANNSDLWLLTEHGGGMIVSNRLYVPFGVIILGSSLTSEEIATINTAVGYLTAAFLVP